MSNNTRHDQPHSQDLSSLPPWSLELFQRPREEEKRDPGNEVGMTCPINAIIIKITISSIVMNLKNSYFALIHLPSCYRTVYYWSVQQVNHIQSQPWPHLLNLCLLCNANFPVLS